MKYRVNRKDYNRWGYYALSTGPRITLYQFLAISVGPEVKLGVTERKKYAQTGKYFSTGIRAALDFELFNSDMFFVGFGGSFHPFMTGYDLTGEIDDEPDSQISYLLEARLSILF